jgi:hypothetical protein
MRMCQLALETDQQLPTPEKTRIDLEKVSLKDPPTLQVPDPLSHHRMRQFDASCEFSEASSRIFVECD